MRRGEVWWASLPEPKGSGPGYRHPVLIVQADEFNSSRIHTVVVVAITSNLSLAMAPGNVTLKSHSSGLPKESVVNVSQVITVDKRFLTDRVYLLDTHTLGLIDDGLRLVLAL